MRFGDIYWIPMKYAPSRGIGNHWVVLLFSNAADNLIYYQTLSSGIYKIFPSFGLFADGQCKSCTKFRENELYLRYKKVPTTFLDVDAITFLNPNKYSFLNKETYIHVRRIEKDGYFDFANKISTKKYHFAGTLSKFNKRSAINALSSSDQISLCEKEEIRNFFVSS